VSGILSQQQKVANRLHDTSPPLCGGGTGCVWCPEVWVHWGAMAGYRGAEIVLFSLQVALGDFQLTVYNSFLNSETAENTQKTEPNDGCFSLWT
jgi:hypothetical protein